MQENTSGKGLKRRVNPLWATIFILFVIAATILVGVIWPLSHGRIDLDPNQKLALEYISWRSKVYDRLGISVGMKRNSSTIVTVLNPGISNSHDLRKGDVITAINGVRVTNIKNLAAQIERIPVEDNIEIDISRAGQPLTIQVSQQDQSHTSLTNDLP
jgi:S1-C subfamily serine protease